MYPVQFWHAVVDDVQSTRQEQARARATGQRLARSVRAPERATGRLRQAMAFALVEAGLRLLTPRPPAEVRRARCRPRGAPPAGR